MRRRTQSVLFILLLLTPLVSSADAYDPAGWSQIGLPSYSNDETQLYEWQPDNKRFTAVQRGYALSTQLYVRYHIGSQRYVWVTGGDPRPIVSGSKVQGWRIGYSRTAGEKWGLDWFFMEQPDWAHWVAVRDRNQPIVYRLDWDGQIVVSEVAPANWANLGGKMDPLPKDQPKCELVANPKSAKSRQPITFTVTLGGRVTEVTIDGKIARLQWAETRTSAQLTTVPEGVGFFTATATVKGPTGEAKCEVSYGVEPGA